MWKRRDTIDLGPWPYAQRPRVLIAIRDAGCTVGICRGPETTADQATRCPLHQLEPCIAVEGADVVVSALDLSGQSGRDVVEGLRMRYRDKQTIVLATVAQTLELGDILDDCTVLPVDAAPEYVAAAVEASIREIALTPGQ
jgi:hypothetical protein